MTDQVEVLPVSEADDDPPPVIPVSEAALAAACEFGRAFMWWDDAFCARVMSREKDHYPPAQIMARFEARLSSPSLPVEVSEAAQRIANMHMLFVGVSLESIAVRNRHVDRLARDIEAYAAQSVFAALASPQPPRDEMSHG